VRQTLPLVDFLLWNHVASDVAVGLLLLLCHAMSGAPFVDLLLWYHVMSGVALVDLLL
jgi:hypothetical protein